MAHRSLAWDEAEEAGGPARGAQPGPAARVARFPAGPEELERLRAGEREAFDAFFGCWLPRVHGWAQARVASPEDARAATEATLSRALARLLAGPPPDSLAALLLAIAREEVALRKRQAATTPHGQPSHGQPSHGQSPRG